MNQPDFERARAYAKARLQRELSPLFVYHSLFHTEGEVVAVVERLAPLEGITGDALLLLRTAAWFHDLGFIEQRDDHERISARIARDVLPDMGYNGDHLVSVTQTIMATRLPQTPLNLSGQIIADADLDVLGNLNFLARNKALRAELASTGSVVTDREWYEGQLRFMESHHYFTRAAEQTNAAQKARNVALVVELLAKS